MRKILLTTTALMAAFGAAQAAEAPVQVTLGGYVDFRAAKYHESSSRGNLPDLGSGVEVRRASGDFQTEYGVNIAADGKASGGVLYGAKIMMNNKAGTFENASTGDRDLKLDQGYVHVGGSFGRFVLGDSRGATELLVYAPTVGEGQIGGSYTNFTDMQSLARFQPMFFDATETATKAAYFTPKVGTKDHKAQIGVSYAANAGRGINALQYKNTTAMGRYLNNVEVVAQYTGDFDPVRLVVTPAFASGKGNAGTLQDYSAWALAGQAMYAGFTVGGSYVDAGNYRQMAENKHQTQDVWTAGLKYEFDKIVLATNYMKGRGFIPSLTNGSGTGDYVNSFKALGLGATYAWAPGMRFALDAVFFNQAREHDDKNNKGHVLMLSQKIAF